mmetsp:Transcript_8357/g.27783  ORF Transcript_8357/g.27783 Transcript_8357/m.27783 type:complete len:248 (+) Transcript_8357:348-1091(+)
MSRASTPRVRSSGTAPGSGCKASVPSLMPTTQFSNSMCTTWARTGRAACGTTTRTSRARALPSASSTRSGPKRQTCGACARPPRSTGSFGTTGAPIFTQSSRSTTRRRIFSRQTCSGGRWTPTSSSGETSSASASPRSSTVRRTCRRGCTRFWQRCRCAASSTSLGSATPRRCCKGARTPRARASAARTRGTLTSFSSRSSRSLVAHKASPTPTSAPSDGRKMMRKSNHCGKLCDSSLKATSREAAL